MFGQRALDGLRTGEFGMGAEECELLGGGSGADDADQGVPQGEHAGKRALGGGLGHDPGRVLHDLAKGSGEIGGAGLVQCGEGERWCQAGRAFNGVRGIAA